MKKYFFLFVLALSFFLANSQPKYEFRGVWVATVMNIDWPNHKSWDPDKQRAEFIRLLDYHKGHGMNAMIVQVRPSADAFYPSPYEPWSQWLTGVQGKAPNPVYDPLAFMIEETHKRGMEFHAWLNPYRAVFNTNSSSITSNHITRQRPEWFLNYGDKKYFDPGNKEAQKFVVNVVHDIVKRYDIDAIHMDDYFYPYRIPGKEFPDEMSYRRSGSSLSKDDWRRSNTDSIIRTLNTVIKKEKPLVRFGISPFSVWRNKDKDPERGSDSRGGQTNYDDLYADILLWLEKGWIDYVTPQLYFTIGHSRVDFAKMTDWWARNSFGRHVYIGHGLYKAQEREPGWNNRNELPNQIKYLRDNPKVHGSIYYSSRSFYGNPNGWNDSLRDHYYKHPALLPPMAWLSKEKPLKPLVDKKIISDSVIDIKVRPDTRNLVDIKYYVVYRKITDAGEDRFEPTPEYITQVIMDTKGFTINESLSSKHRSYRYLITAVGKNNVESEVTEIPIVRQKDGKWKYFGP